MPRLRTSILLAATLAAGIAALLWLLRRPPAIARLLPEGDAILFADLRPLRLATHLERSIPTRSPDYQAFVDATGIVPERDLDQAAFALTRRPDPSGANGPVAYTELLLGHFDPSRLERYLRTLQPATDTYAGHTVFTIRVQTGTAAEGRDVRLAIVRPDLLAVSNTPTPEQLHSILDHARSPLPTAAPSLLTDHFADIPRLSSVWAIGRLGLPFTDPATAPGATPHLTLLGLSLPVPADQTFLLSLRYVGVLRLRIEALAASNDLALEESGALTSLAGLARTLLLAQPGHAPSPELTEALQSLRIEPHGSRAVLTATLPLALARQLTTATNAP